jgi:hypothetical protein
MIRAASQWTAANAKGREEEKKVCPPITPLPARLTYQKKGKARKQPDSDEDSMRE